MIQKQITGDYLEYTRDAEGRQVASFFQISLGASIGHISFQNKKWYIAAAL